MRGIRQNGGDSQPELPELDLGVHLLDVDGYDRATGPLHPLVLDHLLLNEGTAVWVDAGGHAVTKSLASIAPSMRILDRITSLAASPPTNTTNSSANSPNK